MLPQPPHKEGFLDFNEIISNCFRYTVRHFSNKSVITSSVKIIMLNDMPIYEISW